jgi:hypothetical protein
VIPSQVPTTKVIPFLATTLPVVVKMCIHGNLFSGPYGDDTCIMISLCDGPRPISW